MNCRKHQKHAELLKQSQRVSIHLHTNSDCIRDPERLVGCWPIPSDKVSATVNTREFHTKKKRCGRGGCSHWLTWGLRGVKNSNTSNATRMRLLEMQSIAIRLRYACLTHMTSQMCDDLCAGMEENFKENFKTWWTERPDLHFPWVHTIVVWLSYGSSRDINMENNTLKIEAWARTGTL